MCLGIVTIDIKQVLAGIIQMLVGFFVMVVEAPCCCMFIDFVQQVAEKADQRPLWNRAVVYCLWVSVVFISNTVRHDNTSSLQHRFATSFVESRTWKHLCMWIGISNGRCLRNDVPWQEVSTRFLSHNYNCVRTQHLWYKYLSLTKSLCCFDIIITI